jgi:hypothetical protein
MLFVGPVLTLTGGEAEAGARRVQSLNSGRVQNLADRSAQGRGAQTFELRGGTALQASAQDWQYGPPHFCPFDGSKQLKHAACLGEMWP